MASSARRQVSIGAAACLVIAALAYEFVPRDETRITGRLDELCTKLNQTRDPASLAALRQFLSVALRPGVELRVSELDEDLEGVVQASEHAADLLRGPPLTFALSGVEVHQSGALARVEADLFVTVRGSGEQRRDARRTRVRMTQSDAGWQIEAVDVDSLAPSEPEARP